MRISSLVYVVLLLVGYQSLSFADAPKPYNGAPMLDASEAKLSADALAGDAVAAAKLENYYRYNKPMKDSTWKYWALIAAENGFVRSQFDEYAILIVGDDPLSQRRALYWLKKSAQGGDTDANLELKRCFPDGSFESHQPSCVGAEAN